MNELKRRNVVKAAIAYLLVAWVIVQVASDIFPIFDAPPYILKILLFILVIGFIVWMVFSWTYNFTEDGIEKTKAINSDTSVHQQTGNRLSKVIIVGLSLVVIILFFNQSAPENDPASAGQDTIVEAEDGAQKIAVLPFLNTKADKNTDYLGFALADQIIGGLVYVNSINVRPSSYIRKYENTTISPTEIGKELDVKYLLSGNYLMEAGVIRLNIELVNTDTNSIIFREPLQLGFQSAFELQDIVSKKIIEKLKLHFTPSERSRIQKDIPRNALAYEYYLRALSFPKTTTGADLAIPMLNKSIELDAMFAPSFSELGKRFHYRANYGLGGAEDQNNAEISFLKALALNDELLSAYLGLSNIYTEAGKTIESVKTIKKALELNPNTSTIHKSLGYIYRYAGLIEKSIEEMNKAIELDNTIDTTIGIAYISIGEYEKAFESFEAKKGDTPTTLQLAFQGISKYRQGNYPEAMSMFNKIYEINPDNLNYLWVLTFIGLIEGDIEKGLVAARKFEEYDLTDSEPWFFIGVNYALLGDKESALRCLNRSVDSGYFNYPIYLNEPFLDSLRDDEEFKKILSRVKEKHLYLKKTLPTII